MGIIHSKTIGYFLNNSSSSCGGSGCSGGNGNKNCSSGCNNNTYSYFQTLPRIIVFEIVSYLSTVDKLCFVLTCKKWYQFRKKFIQNLTKVKITHIPLSNTKYQLTDTPEHKGITKTIDDISYLQQINNEPIRKIIFSSHFYQLLHAGDIPVTVKKVKFLSPQYKHKIDVGVLPESLESLEISFPITESLDPNSLPCNLRKLTFTNQGVCSTLSKSMFSSTSLRSLNLGLFFNSPITPNLLPPTLTHLDLGSSFAQPLEVGSIPSGVRKLIFSCNYTLEMTIPPGIIPNSVVSLAVTYHGTAIHIPASVTDLKLECQATIPDGLIPATVTKLWLSGNYYYARSTNALPSKLKSLVLDYEHYPNTLLPFIPKTVSDLTFGWLYNVKLDFKQLPPQLLKLSFSEYFDQPINNLPSTLRHLKIGKDYCEFSHPLPTFSSTLTRMSIGSNYPTKIGAALPPIKQLSLRGYFYLEAANIILNSNLPTNIKLSKSKRIRVLDSSNCIIYTKSTIQFIKLHQLELFQK